jgi:glycosyltransferase involved in cell wall biosynthesis
MVTVGIAIPTKNRAATLERTIALTLEQMPDCCFLHVLDNGSDDWTADLLASIDHPRFFAHYDPPSTPAHDGFVRVLEEASRHDYAVLMSDEDEVVWPEFEGLLDVLKGGPSFVSTTFRCPPAFVRSGQSGRIAPWQWFSGSFYCSGLVYRGSDLLKVGDILRGRFADSVFMRLYPQSALQLVMLPLGEQVWSPLELCRARETQATTLFAMDDGSHYAEQGNRRKIAAAYQSDVDYLLRVLPEHGRVWDEARRDGLLGGWQ